MCSSWYITIGWKSLPAWPATGDNQPNFGSTTIPPWRFVPAGTSTAETLPRPAGYRAAVPRGDHVDVELAGRTVRITSPAKVMFPERGETKLDLVRYYESIEAPIMRSMGGRP